MGNSTEKLDESSTDYVDDRELERRTGIPRSTWQRFRQQKRGPIAYKVGRRVIYSWRRVEEWIASQAAGGGK